MAFGRSLHIGLNHVDPNAYNGWDGELFGCINDANSMKAIADSLKYTSMILTDSQASSWRVIQEIASASQALQTGDIYLITYSGHGGQVHDSNSDEEDAMDETWVLWDREVIDDELASLYSPDLVVSVQTLLNAKKSGDAETQASARRRRRKSS